MQDGGAGRRPAGRPRAASDSRGTPEVGLCARCRHGAGQRNRRGSTFWRCRRADADPRFRRYPPLPVTRCDGFEEGVPSTSPTEEPP